jgi:hypothetical protein
MITSTGSLPSSCCALCIVCMEGAYALCSMWVCAFGARTLHMHEHLSAFFFSHLGFFFLSNRSLPLLFLPLQGCGRMRVGGIKRPNFTNEPKYANRPELCEWVSVCMCPSVTRPSAPSGPSFPLPPVFLYHSSRSSKTGAPKKT